MQKAVFVETGNYKYGPFIYNSFLADDFVIHFCRQEIHRRVEHREYEETDECTQSKQCDICELKAG